MATAMAVRAVTIPYRRPACEQHLRQAGVSSRAAATAYAYQHRLL